MTPVPRPALYFLPFSLLSLSPRILSLARPRMSCRKLYLYAMHQACVFVSIISSYVILMVPELWKHARWHAARCGHPARRHLL